MSSVINCSLVSLKLIVCSSVEAVTISSMVVVSLVTSCVVSIVVKLSDDSCVC